MNITTWGMNKFNITLTEMDSDTQILMIDFMEDAGGKVEFRIYSGLDKHFPEDFLKLFNIKIKEEK
tara:strand:- start:414 stop:611 length:198 start_codon:yes stop_codon:yes gene_type:complete